MDRLTRRRPRAASPGRASRYWRCDPRYVAGIAGFLIAPVVIIVTELTNPQAGGSIAMLAPAFIAVFVGMTSCRKIWRTTATAIWLHISTGVSGYDDRSGRVMATLTISRSFARALDRNRRGGGRSLGHADHGGRPDARPVADRARCGGGGRNSLAVAGTTAGNQSLLAGNSGGLPSLPLLRDERPRTLILSVPVAVPGSVDLVVVGRLFDRPDRVGLGPLVARIGSIRAGTCSIGGGPR